MSSLLRTVNEGVEFYVRDTDGKTGLSQVGLARLAGISAQTITNLVRTVSSSSSSSLPEALKPFAGGGFALQSDSPIYKNANVLSSEFCVAVLIHYSCFSSQNKSNTAAYSLLKFGTMGFDKWVQGIINWQPPNGLNAEKVCKLIGGEDTEKRLQNEIALLSLQSGIRLMPEFTVDDDRRNFRSYDLVGYQPRRKVIVYELKHPLLMQDHICTIQGERRYLRLAHQRFPGKDVKIVFCAFGAEQYALDMLYGQPHYSYLNIYTLTERLYWNAVNRLAPNAVKFRANEYLSTFEGILSPKLVATERARLSNERSLHYSSLRLKVA